MESLGISEATTRVAVSRMVAAGDLLREGSTYALAGRLVERQRRQDAAITPAVRRWDGSWEVVVVTASRRLPAARAALRTELADLRLAELREGVWMRPANLARAWPSRLTETTRRLVTRPVDDAVALAGELWDLAAWAAYGRGLLTAMARTDEPAARFATMAAIVRHLRADPVLPPALRPAGWPGEELRSAYADYHAELSALIPTRAESDPEETETA
jgi:phenylacetic acid degradation operon negative regulatory protein